MTKIAAMLIPLYLLVLPFLRIGLPVKYFRFSLPDVVLAVALVFVLVGIVRDLAAKREVFGRDYLRFGLFFAVFLAAGTLSVCFSADPRAGAVDLLPLFYAGGLIILLSRVFHAGIPFIAAWLRHALLATVGLISLVSLIPGQSAGLLHRLTFDGMKYVFFTLNPNQLSIIVLVYFSMYLMLRIEERGRAGIGDVLMPAFFLNAILWSGSRIAFFSALLLVLAYAGVLVRDVFVRSPQTPVRRAAVLVLAFVAALSVFVYHFRVLNNWTAYRSVSGVTAILVKYAPWLMPKEGRLFNSHESVGVAFSVRKEINTLAIKCFKEHPWIGVGLGQFKGHYHHYEVHNSLLGTAAETGLVGLAALILLTGYLIFLFVRWGLRRPVRLLEHGFVLAAVLLPHWFHFLLRERWIWFFSVFLVYLFVDISRDGTQTGTTAR